MDRGLSDPDCGRVRYAFKIWKESKPWYPTPADIIDALPKTAHIDRKRLPYIAKTTDAEALEYLKQMRKAIDLAQV